MEASHTSLYYNQEPVYYVPSVVQPQLYRVNALQEARYIPIHWLDADSPGYDKDIQRIAATIFGPSDIYLLNSSNPAELHKFHVNNGVIQDLGSHILLQDVLSKKFYIQASTIPKPVQEKHSSSLNPTKQSAHEQKTGATSSEDSSFTSLTDHFSLKQKEAPSLEYFFSSFVHSSASSSLIGNAVLDYSKPIYMDKTLPKNAQAYFGYQKMPLICSILILKNEQIEYSRKIDDRDIKALIQGINKQTPYYVFLENHANENEAYLFTVNGNQAIRLGCFSFYHIQDKTTCWLKPNSTFIVKKKAGRELEPNEMEKWLQTFISNDFEPLELSKEDCYRFKLFMDMTTNTKSEAHELIDRVFIGSIYPSTQEPVITEMETFPELPTFIDLFKLNQERQMGYPISICELREDYLSNDFISSMKQPYFFLRNSSQGADKITLVTCNLNDTKWRLFNIVSIQENQVLLSIDLKDSKLFINLDALMQTLQRKLTPILMNKPEKKCAT